jgi:pyridoxal phosphate enzyme (YggS family)
MATIADNLQVVKARIARAARSAGRDPATVTLLAVSKTHPVARVEEALRAGQKSFGENYVQDALEKMHALPQAEWHLIGALQSNKARIAAQRFDWIQCVDREKIALRLSEHRPLDRPALNVLIQVNVSAEATKAGVAPAALPALAEKLAALPRLRLRGLMCIPPPREGFEAQRQLFAELADCARELREQGMPLDTLSMGMSGDLEAAIAEGATLVRIGTAIFGPRP